MELRPGVRIDRYTLVEPLGRGGQGAVWKVVDPLDGVVRALKLIELRGLDAATVERARREAKAVAGVTHPALIPCRGLFEELTAGLIGLVFDFVSGTALVEAAKDPRMSPAHREGALRQIASALAHVHGLGMVHRDLKPENVLVSAGFWGAPEAPGGVRLLDFGISAPADNRRGITAPGLVIGTLPYLAPELMAPGLWLPLPEGFSRDLFAFGVLGFELCTGAHPTGLPVEAPVEAFVSAYRAADAGQRPWPPPGVEGALGAALGACLQIDPRRRPLTAAALLDMMGVASAPTVPRASLAAGQPFAPTEVQGALRSGAMQAASTGASGQVPTGFVTSPTVAVSHTPGAMAYGVAPDGTASSPPGPGQSGGYAMTPSMPGAPGAGPSGGYAVMPSAPPMPGAPGTGPMGSAVVPAPAAPAQRGRSSLPLVIGLLAGVAVAVVATVMIVRSRPEPEAPAPVPVAPPPPTPVVETAQEPSVPVPCCPANGRCPLPDRACVPAPCQDQPLPEQTWWLRPTGMVARGKDGRYTEGMMEAHPRAEVCLRLASGGDEVCSPVRVVGLRDQGPRLEVTTADVLNGQVHVRVVEGGATIANERTVAIRDGLLSSALCKGLMLHVGARDRGPARLFAELIARAPR